LGGLRALAQTISYEVRLAFILLSFVILICRYNLAYFYFSGLIVVSFSSSSFVVYLIYFLFGWHKSYSFWFCRRWVWTCFWA